MEKTARFACRQELAERLRGKRVLVTGAGGLVGSTFVDLLMALDRLYGLEISVSVLGRNRNALEARFDAYCSSNGGFRIIEGDVSSVDLSGQEADYVVHAASPAHPLAYAKTPVDVMKANLLGTLNLLELARRCGARLLFVSSGEIYGISDQPDSAFGEGGCGRIDISDPRSCYPESKRAAETLCAAYGAQYGVDAVIARLCHVYGPAITQNNSRADAQFLRNVLAHEDIVMKSPGSQVRSFCYVKDAASGLLYILLEGKTGEAYNVANGNSVATIRQYAQTLAELGGVKIRDEYPTQTEASGYSRVTRAVLDAAKLQRLGWEPQYDLRNGLADMIVQSGRMK